MNMQKEAPHRSFEVTGRREQHQPQKKLYNLFWFGTTYTAFEVVRLFLAVIIFLLAIYCIVIGGSVLIGTQFLGWTLCAY